MNNTKSKFKSINNFLMQESTILANELNSITETLKDMTDNGLINSFSYSSNIDDENSGFSKRVRIDVAFADSGSTILGILDNIKKNSDAPAAMGDEIHKKLSEINQYLLFVNQHLKDHVPTISVNTYYSKKAVELDGGWKDSTPVALFPDFVHNKVRTNKPY